MKRSRETIVALLITLFIASCETTLAGPRSIVLGGEAPRAVPPVLLTSGPRSIVLEGETYSETDLGKFTSWRCKDYYTQNTDTLVEVGTFADSDLEGSGFILYDGSYSGESTSYQRRGINHRWNWGPDGSVYTFIIKPDGTGFFYDFSSVPEGERVKPDTLYKCYQ